jgi:hypothetical protein
MISGEGVVPKQKNKMEEAEHADAEISIRTNQVTVSRDSDPPSFMTVT